MSRTLAQLKRIMAEKKEREELEAKLEAERVEQAREEERIQKEQAKIDAWEKWIFRKNRSVPKAPPPIRHVTESSVVVNQEKPPEIKKKPHPLVVAVVGKVDSGKTTLMDTLRNTSTQKDENRGISQQITSFYHPETNIIFIDTPGHVPFSNSKERCMEIADKVLVVVCMYQDYSTVPVGDKFIYALNKIDALASINENKAAKLEDPDSKRRIDEYIQKFEYAMAKKTDDPVVVIPVSARTGENVDTLLSQFDGFEHTQLADCVVLDVLTDNTVEVVGTRRIIDTTQDMYLPDGHQVHMGRANEFGQNLFRLRGSGFQHAIPGDRLSYKAPIQRTKDYTIETGTSGIDIYANSYCALEALVSMIRPLIGIRSAKVGNASVKAGDVAVLFNVKLNGINTGKRDTTIIEGHNVYRITELVKNFVEAKENDLIEKNKQFFVVPVVLTHQGKVFRKSNPLIFEAQVSAGRLVLGAKLYTPAMEELGEVVGIRSTDEAELTQATVDQTVSVAVKNVKTRSDLSGTKLNTVVTNQTLKLLPVFAKKYLPGEMELCKKLPKL